MSTVLEVGQTGLTTAEGSAGLLVPGPCNELAPRPLSLRSNFSWTFAGNVVHDGCKPGMLMVLAKFNSPERVGNLAIGLAVTIPPVVCAVAYEIILVVHASTLRHHDAARTWEILHNLGTPVLGMIVNGIGHPDSGYGCGHYRSHGARGENGKESRSLPLLATTPTETPNKRQWYVEACTVIQRPTQC